MNSKNEKFLLLIDELNTLLSPIQKEVSQRYTLPQSPIGLIIGPPRSGTTIFLQFLASTNHLSYPTNLMTRFALAPYLGAIIQKILFDPSNDVSYMPSQLCFESNLGKSKGILGTNEFFHFWRKWIKKSFPEALSNHELSNIDFKEIGQTLASIEAAFNKPFCTKGMFHQFNLKAFYENQPYLFFFRILREPFYICQSLWFAREQYFGDRSKWYSVKPEEYRWLKKMDIYHQIAGQVFFTEEAINEGLKHVPDRSYLTVKYEGFCKNPKDVYMQIVDKYSDLDCELPIRYSGPGSFNNSNKIRLPAKDEHKLRKAYEYFSSGKNSFDNNLSACL